VFLPHLCVPITRKVQGRIKSASADETALKRSEGKTTRKVIVIHPEAEKFTGAQPVEIVDVNGSVAVVVGNQIKKRCQSYYFRKKVSKKVSVLLF
jgi:hypothetical protein